MEVVYIVYVYIVYILVDSLSISLSYQVLPPSQIVSRLTFFTPSLTTRLIQKNLYKYSQI